MKRKTARKIDDALEESAETVTATAAAGKKGYDLDAEAIAGILVRHYGDEAEAVLDRAKLFLGDARNAVRKERRARRKRARDDEP